jgi:hypothetical protein
VATARYPPTGDRWDAGVMPPSGIDATTQTQTKTSSSMATPPETARPCCRVGADNHDHPPDPLMCA